MRQIAGNAAVSAGDSSQVDPLNAPFTLYVNPYTGSDEFVGGAYNSFEAGATQQEVIESKLKRLEKQRLTCGFTPQRPFRTINRAVIEAAIITSKDWYTITDPAAHVDCVSIVLAPGVHTLYNDPGEASTSITSWGTSKNPSTADLIKFNPATVGGVLLPRGCSLCGADLRKVTIRPNWVPAVADEAADYSNRRGMLKITGTGYFFGFTVMDKVNNDSSHHLLDAFHFASKAELDAFYAKTLSAVGDGADLAAALTVTRGTEYQIVGPIERTQAPTSAWDTTSSASPYIFNCSVRSNYGLGGAFMDGAKVSGLKSMVTANFTGVSLQKDMSCWQRYSGNSWTTTTYEQYITADPDNVRMNPLRMSRHISAINDAFIQEVSIFAIGQGAHHFTDRGGEITITNSNSSFGGCAAISKGYKSFAFPLDRNWTVDAIRVPLNLGEKTGNIRRIYLGTIAAISATKITLDTALATDSKSTTVPAILLRDGYTFASGTRLWVENPVGDHWRTSFTAAAWSSANPNEINVTGALQQSGTNAAPGINPDTGVSFAVGKRVYIRRLVDTRTPEERRVSIKLNNTAVSRLPQRNFILQTDPNRAGGAVSALFSSTGDDVILVGATGIGDTQSTGVARTSEITLRRGAPDISYATSTFYRAGTVVKYQGKHYQSLVDQTTGASGGPNPATWGEAYVHMRSDYNPEDSTANEAPIVFLDTDTSDNANSETLGLNFNTGWTTEGALRNQYRTGVDYLGVHAFLVALGFSSTAAHDALVPRAANQRDRDPTSSADFPVSPSGRAATGLGNWAVEFRRPSVLRLYGHAWEWAGFLNYSKALPAAQQELGPQNKFTYYFTSDSGGRVVPQGSNEDGFNITPRGLEDVETGATLSVDAIGSSTLDDFQITDFPNGLSASRIEVDNLIVNNTAQLPAITTTTTTAGPVELASASELRDGASIFGGNDSQLDNSINADPVVVTKKGLEYWKLHNRLASTPVGVQYIYVRPDAARSDTDINVLLSDPPLNNPAKAIRSLAAAVNYANQAFGPTATIEYRLGAGVYLDQFGVDFNTIAIVRAWDYAANTYLNNDSDGGTIPFFGGENETYSHYLDPTKQPIFLSSPYIDYGDNGISPGEGYALSLVYPFSFNFNYRGVVIGVAWWGVTETVTAGYRGITAGKALIPDSVFTRERISVTNWRDAAFADPDNSLNYFIREITMQAQSASGTKRYYGHRARAFIRFNREGEVYNCAFGSISPAAEGIIGGERQFESAIEVGADPVAMSGIRLIGNTKISSEVNTGSYAAIRTRQHYSLTFNIATYRYTGFAQSMIGPSSLKQRTPICVNFGTIAGRANLGLYYYNFPWVNWTLLYANYSNGTVTLGKATSTSDPSNSGWKTVGPAFSYFINVIFGTTSTTYRNWNRFNAFAVGSTNTCGFDGKFGDYNDSQTSATSSTPVKTRSTLTEAGCRIEPMTIFYGDVADTLFSVAGGDLSVTGSATPNVNAYVSGLSTGEIGSWTTFTPLNIQLRGHKLGINTTNATTITYQVVL